MKKVLFLLFFLFFNFETNAEEQYLSLKNKKVNVRYCPELNCPIKYIYRKINYPVKQIDKKENFRKIIDIKKNSGWIHISQLKKSKSFIIMKDKILFKKPSFFSKPILKLEKGRLVLVKKCQSEWCKVKTDDYLGWLNIENIWGYVD